MKIVCVYSVENFHSTEKPLFEPHEIPFGISCVATALKAAGHDLAMAVITPYTDMEKLFRRYLAADCKLFCFSAVSSQYQLICTAAREVRKQAPSIRIMLGGHHATLNPDGILEAEVFDAICIGEGEKAVVEYAGRLMGGEEPTGINNLWIRRNDGTVEKNPPDEFIQDLDALPFIDRKMWEEWVADTGRMPSILVGRGCPNKCAYCSNHALCRIAKGRYVRSRSPENVTAELEQLAAAYPAMEQVYLEVETLGVNLEYTFALCDALVRFNARRATPIRFGTNLALIKKIAANEELLKRLKEAHFTFLNIGLESGSERVRQEILHRPGYSNDEIIGFCALAKKYGIDVSLYVLIGVPGETYADFRETVAVVRACRPANISLSIFQPYPGTDLYRTAREMGVLDDSVSFRGERRKANLDLPGFSRRQIQRAYLMFYFNVFKGVKPLPDRVAVTLRTFSGMYPKVNSIYNLVTAMPAVRMLKKMLKIGK